MVPRVAVAAVIIRDGRVLLVKRKNEPNKNKYSLPGGKVELGERLVDALKREIREELSISIKPDGIVFIKDEIIKQESRVRFHYVIIDFLVRDFKGKVRINKESSSYAWVPLNELNKFKVSRSTLECINKIRTGITFPYSR